MPFSTLLETTLVQAEAITAAIERKMINFFIYVTFSINLGLDIDTVIDGDILPLVNGRIKVHNGRNHVRNTVAIKVIGNAVTVRVGGAAKAGWE